LERSDNVDPVHPRFRLRLKRGYGIHEAALVRIDIIKVTIDLPNTLTAGAAAPPSIGRCAPAFPVPKIWLDIWSARHRSQRHTPR
jgi:hypothetical protein